MSAARWGAICVGVAMLAASPAFATPFTLSNTVQITAANNGGTNVLGQLLPVFDISGAASLLAGVVDLPNQDFFVFKLELYAGSDRVDQIGAAKVGVTPVLGVGFFDDLLGKNPTDGALSPITPPADTGIFNYSHTIIPDPGNLIPLETTDRLFVTYASGKLPGFLTLTSHMISSNTDFTITTGQLVEIVAPEPSVLLLMGAALAGLGISAILRSRA